ncbi:MAG: CRISPR system precrRNA processing endoribonuclease RAMP protein Cas6 [Bryobacteraceae bacterium]
MTFQVATPAFAPAFRERTPRSANVRAVAGGDRAGAILTSLHFQFHRFRFQFRSAGTLYFPPYKSGNIVRGAFGEIFRKLVCVPTCTGAKTCDLRATCPYARVFEPGPGGAPSRGGGPSGLADWPRPFVFRAAQLDGRTIREGEPFHFDVHIFDVRDPSLSYFVLAFAQLAREGLGPGRGRAELTAVDQLDLAGAAVSRVFDGARFQMNEMPPPIVVDLAAPPEPATRVRVRFVTPTELKTEHQLADRPEFGILFGRLRDRISTLRTMYGPGPLEIDFRAMGDRAAAVRMTRCELQRHEVERRSSRTGQRHPLGGFVGKAEYEGDLGEFLPYLRLGKWVGVGRQTVWGKGEIYLVEINSCLDLKIL